MNTTIPHETPLDWVGGPVAASGSFPLVLIPSGPGLDIVDWARRNADRVRSVLLERGAILFRNFDCATVESFQAFANVFITRHMAYEFAMTETREHITSQVASASRVPPTESIPPHSEMDAQSDWPRTLLFYCSVAPRIDRAGNSGETPIVPTRRVYARLPGEIRDRFDSLGVKYVRNIRGTEALEKAFHTAVPEQITQYCSRHDLKVTFEGPQAVRTERVGKAVVPHPITREPLWFNKAHAYHLSSLPRDFVQKTHGLRDGDPDPFEVYYGDGSTIDRATIRQIRRAYESETVSFFWQANDVLLLDNMLAAHARRPFTGPRRILISMGDSYRNFVESLS